MSNRLSEIAPAGRRTLRREIRVPILYIIIALSIYILASKGSGRL